GPPFNPLLSFQPIEETTRRSFLDFEELSYLRLAETRTAMQPSNSQPLSACQTQFAHAAVADRAQETRYIGNDVADIGLIIERHRNKSARPLSQKLQHQCYAFRKQIEILVIRIIRVHIVDSTAYERNRSAVSPHPSC